MLEEVMLTFKFLRLDQSHSASVELGARGHFAGFMPVNGPARRSRVLDRNAASRGGRGLGSGLKVKVYLVYRGVMLPTSYFQTFAPRLKPLCHLGAGCARPLRWLHAIEWSSSAKSCA